MTDAKTPPSMPTVAPPRCPNSAPDRDVDAQFSIEPVFQAARDAAVSEGWDEREVAKALISLAEKNYLTMLEDRLLDGQIAEARRRRAQ